jgi:hypothetical protein
MTCAAVGALVYGWYALSDSERDGILSTLSAGLEVGVELIKAVIAFVVRHTKELLDPEALKEFKTYIADKAALFGRKLSDVTHQTLDLLSDAAVAARRAAKLALTSAAEVAASAGETVGQKWRPLMKDDKRQSLPPALSQQVSSTSELTEPPNQKSPD